MKPNIQMVLVGAILLFVGIAAGYYISTTQQDGTINPAPPVNTNNNNIVPAPIVTSFDECAAAGYPVMESYPRQCRTPQGGVFVEYIGNELEKLDLIRITNPRPNQIITSPLTITGEARGTWYFEATFPVVLTDREGNVITQHYAQAQSEWMTEDFVPFKSTLMFNVLPAQKTGFLILKKDNPSGLPKHDDELRIPIEFSES